MKENFWWITTSDKGHMKTLGWINGDADKDNMTNNIYFKSEKEAIDFLTASSRNPASVHRTDAFYCSSHVILYQTKKGHPEG